MKKDIHPQWYDETSVTCACGNTWVTSATVSAIRTDICSKCHPFFTGEQRIVDTEGQVDRFMKRLQRRDNIMTAADEREAAKTPSDLPISELELSSRYITILNKNDIDIVADIFSKLENEGDDGLLAIPGIGRKILSDIKRNLKDRGYELPSN